jgi:hypothetical protein
MREKYPLFVASAKSSEGIQELFEQIARIVHGKAGNVTLPTQVVMGQEIEQMTCVDSDLTDI